MKVKIAFTERVTYHAEVEMPREEFDKLTAMLDSGSRPDERLAGDEISSHVHRVRDWFDADDIEVDVFEEVKP
jgi:hypothetical protein